MRGYLIVIDPFLSMFAYAFVWVAPSPQRLKAEIASFPRRLPRRTRRYFDDKVRLGGGLVCSGWGVVYIAVEVLTSVSHASV